jgi:5-methylcytosine-specific restriction endonuclease McrA
MVGRQNLKRLLTALALKPRDEREQCPLCGGSLLEAEVDHKQPVSRGGTSFPENLWLVCKGCNRKKGDMTLYEFNLRGSR